MTYPDQPSGQWQQPQNPGQQPYEPQQQYQQPQNPQPKQMSVTVDLNAISSKLTPRVVTLSTAVLGLLTVITYMMKWRSSKNSSYNGNGLDLSVNGFGLRKTGAGAGGIDVAIHNLGTFAFIVALVVIFLFVAATVVFRFTNAPKTGAILLSIAGGISTLYCFIGLFSNLGMTKISVYDYEIDTGVSFGVFLALLVSLATLALGVITLLTAPGPLLPSGMIVRSEPGTPAYLRPAIVAAISAGLLILLVISYILTWRSDDDYGDEVAINGLTTRKGLATQMGLVSDVSVLSLWPAALIFLAIAAGALLLTITHFRRLGASLILIAGIVSFINTLYAIFTDYGLYGDLGDVASSLGADNDSSPAIGAFLAALISIALIAISVFYLFKGTVVLPRPEARNTTQPSQMPSPGITNPSTTKYDQAPRHAQQPQTPPENNGPQNPPAGPAPGRWS